MSEGFSAVDRSGPDQRRAKRRLVEREQKTQEQLDVAALMEEPFGRRIVHRLIAQAGCFRVSYTEGDPHHTSFREGERNIGNWLMSQVIAETPEQYALMLKEQNNG